MATNRWIANRVVAEQGTYDGQVASPERDAAGRICEPVAHQRLHSGIDVSIQLKRIETLWHTARSKLLLIQKHRHQGLVAGAVKLQKDCYMDTDETVYGPVVQPQIVPQPEPDIEEQPDSASASADKVDDSGGKQKKMGDGKAEKTEHNGHQPREMDLPAWLAMVDQPPHPRVRLPFTLPSSAASWVGYTVVGSM
jgi:hypothetical protein